jgi:hypothetical protein
MSLWKKITGDKEKSPGEMAAPEVETALRKLRAQREAAELIVAGAFDRRQAALADDLPDAELIKIDRERDAAELTIERAEALEPRLIARLSELQDAQRTALFNEMLAVFRDRESLLDAALAVAVDRHADYLAIKGQIETTGFSSQLASLIVLPPLLHDGVRVSKELLDLWRAERDRLASRRAALASGRPIDPVRAPRKVVPIVPAPAAAQAPEPAYRPKPSRPPLKEEGSPPFGFSKIVVLRQGLEVNGERRVAGDELILSNDDADAALRTGGAEIVERGAITSEAAQ